jgi:hypothetical protein
MKYYLLYKTEDLSPISFLADDIIDRYTPAEGQSISVNSVDFEEVPYLHEISINSEGTLVKL